MDCPHKSPVRDTSHHTGKAFTAFNKVNDTSYHDTSHKDKNEDENIDKSIDRELYGKAFTAFNKVNHSPPICCDNNVAKFHVVRDIEKINYGRPYFMCSKATDRCRYFEWGDKVIPQRPRCYHNETSKRRRVMKPGPNKGRLFFSCPRQYNDVAQCTFFQWEDETPIPKTPPKREKKDDDDDIISQFTFPKIPSCQYRIPKRKKTPPLEEKNSDDDDIIPNSQPQKRKKTPPLEEKNKDDDTIPDSQSYTSEWMTPQRKKSEILSSDSEEEERNPFLFYTRNPRNRSFYC
jgi:hypothetical protein